jgi:hypothetical protein
MPAVLIVMSVVMWQPDADIARHFLKSDQYTVKWNEVGEVDSSAELEIGDGSGHGFTLRWLRFTPRKDQVEVLSITLEEDRPRFVSKWPPNIFSLKVQKAEMSLPGYTAMLRQLAILQAAKLKVRKNARDFGSSGDFWAHARLATIEKTLFEQEFAGDKSGYRALEAAKSRAMAALVCQMIVPLKFQETALTKEDRTWASAKFARDWKGFLQEDFHWWVCERSIQMIGLVGDDSALPVLREILDRDKEERVVYYSINAITRLTNKDLRDKPVEEMDVKKTRECVIDFLKQRPAQ